MKLSPVEKMKNVHLNHSFVDYLFTYDDVEASELKVSDVEEGKVPLKNDTVYWKIGDDLYETSTKFNVTYEINLEEKDYSIINCLKYLWEFTSIGDVLAVNPDKFLYFVNKSELFKFSDKFNIDYFNGKLYINKTNIDSFAVALEYNLEKESTKMKEENVVQNVAKQFNHVDDCWNALRNCKTINEVESLFKEFPRKFGEWQIEIEHNHYVVYNLWHDSNCHEDYFQCEELGIECKEDK